MADVGVADLATPPPVALRIDRNRFDQQAGGEHFPDVRVVAAAELDGRFAEPEQADPRRRSKAAALAQQGCDARPGLGNAELGWG